jgi:hypothetical protein
MNTIRHTIAKSPQWYDPGEHLRYRSLVRQTGTSHWRPQSVLLWIPGSAFTGVHRAFSYGFRERSLASTERSLMDTIRNALEIIGTIPGLLLTFLEQRCLARLPVANRICDVRAVVKTI